MPYYRRLRDLREDADKTQTEVGRVIGTTAQYYGRYEMGQLDLPLARAIKLADYFQVSLDYMTGRSDIPNAEAVEKQAAQQERISDAFCSLSDRSKGRVEQLIEDLKQAEKQ